ncbi:MAG TPA: DUF192 domain-containing protein [Candidatus Saccharimonadales bacterium]|nr:DUF192 domain-containing protein [Candidatus Saccharimonadales bacterium]
MHRVRRLPIKTTVFAGLVVLLAALLIVTLSIRLASANCNQEYRDDENINVNGQIIRVQVAATTAEQDRGLGGKSCISDNQAMLFKPQSSGTSVWMKDMNFPIDIVWINSKHEVVQIDSNISPKTYPKSFASAQPASYVMELKAGRASSLGLGAGSLINL